MTRLKIYHIIERVHGNGFIEIIKDALYITMMLLDLTDTRSQIVAYHTYSHYMLSRHRRKNKLQRLLLWCFTRIDFRLGNRTEIDKVILCEAKQ